MFCPSTKVFYDPLIKIGKILSVAVNRVACFTRAPFHLSATLCLNISLLDTDNASSAANLEVPTFDLVQSDFEAGTYRITEPGRYVLQEDITFNPNAPTGSQDAYDSFFPTDAQLSNASLYPAPVFTLGFFAAITVETSNVEIDLNGFTFEQGTKRHL